MADETREKRDQWQEDFPVEWERDHYVTRRELAKFLTLGSVLLAGANVAMALLGRTLSAPGTRRVRICRADEMAPGATLLFRYPTPEDPCILLRARSGELRAFSQVCTHLSCAVVYRPDREALFCPCHQGAFSLAEGRPTAGPPTRRLPRIRIEEREGELFAVGVEA